MGTISESSHPVIVAPNSRIAPIRSPRLNITTDEPRAINPDWLENVVNRFVYALDRMNNQLFDYSRDFDQYQPEGVATESETTLGLLASYEYRERVEQIVVIGPPIIPSSPGSTLTGNSGPQTAPAANTTLANIAIPPAGPYAVTVYFTLAGTPAQGTDNNNIKLLANNVTFATLDNNITTAQQIFGPFTINADGVHNFAVQNSVAGTAGSIYQALLVATPIPSVEVTVLGTPFTLQLGSRVWNLVLPPTGILVISPVAMILERDDIRQLTSATAGDWSVELMGHADIPYRRP